MEFSEEDGKSAFVADMVRALMARKGIPKRSQTKTLSEILELSFSQSHRKLSGGSDWTLGQIRQVADHFGESLDTLGISFSPSPPPFENDEVEALFCIGQHSIPCFVQIGATLNTVKNVDYVAVKVGDLWRVVPSMDAPNDVARHRVKRLEICLRQTGICSVAVLDDDRAAADTLRDYINEAYPATLTADSFYETGVLQEALDHKSYDAFVIDWLIGAQTTESLIRKIRGVEGVPVPIILLTGELSTGRAHESEFARVIKEYNVAWQVKPTRLPLIAAELSKVLGIV